MFKLKREIIFRDKRKVITRKIVYDMGQPLNI